MIHEKLHACLAFTFRELQAALLNRTITVWAVVSLIAGIIAIYADVVSDSTSTSGYLLLQVALYLIPLISILIGTGAAQSESEEHAFLMSQPDGRSARILGKFTALTLVGSIAALLLVAPAACFGAKSKVLLFLWTWSSGLVAVFAGLGLAVGFSTFDRVKAHMIALSIWFLLLAGGDLAALAAAQTGLAESLPNIWVLLIMLNPLDAFRISTLISLDRVPFDVSAAPQLGQWWLTHLSIWFGVICAAWIVLALLWSRRRLDLLEV